MPPHMPHATFASSAPSREDLRRAEDRKVNPLDRFRPHFRTGLPRSCTRITLSRTCLEPVGVGTHFNANKLEFSRAAI